MNNHWVLKINVLLIVLLIVLCTTVFYYWPRKDYSVSMNVYTANVGVRNHFTLEQLLKDKAVTQYQLTGKEARDKEILKTYKYDLVELTHSTDTSKVIRFTFNKVTNYQQFMDVFDNCFITNAYYVYYKNDLWIMNKRLINKRNEYLFYDAAYTYNETTSSK